MIDDQIVDQPEVQEEYQEDASVEEAPQESEEQQAPQPQPQAQVPQQPTQAELNMKRMREDKARAERERDDLLRRVDAMEKKMNPQPEPQPQDDPISYAADDLIEGRHLSQYDKKLKALEQQIQKYQQQTAETVVESKIKSQYADFYDVVTPDNLELLKITYPELNASIHSNPDLYNKAVSAYTLIKKLGIQSEPQAYNPEQNRIQQNTSKPRSVASVAPQSGDSPLARANAFANGLTDDLKAQLYKEMIEAKNRG
jgi:hypothetical protein